MNLVGKWSTVQGTFDVVMTDTWEFRSDGIVIVGSCGAFGSLNSVEEYRWEQCGPFQVRISFPPDDDCSEITWSRPMTYEFGILQHDAGQEVVLHESGKDGFWLADVPLRPEWPNVDG